MLSPKGFLPPNADAFGRRAHDHILPLRRLRSPMEGKLARCIFLSIVLLLLSVAQAAGTPNPFRVVVFMCVWKRPKLTHFVLQHYNAMKPELLSDHNIALDVFITGSDNATTPHTAVQFGTGYAVHPNRPVGSKHNWGLQSLRGHYERSPDDLPDAVAIMGSDDIINAAFFVKTKELMTRAVNNMHIVGLRDIYFFDLHSLRLMYTAGYREFVTPVSGTVGCGRVFSWAMLETLDWELWDWARDRSLDQSSIRRILKLVPQISEVSAAISGVEHGIAAVDVKTDAFEEGANIWGFDQIVKAVGKNGPLHEFQEKDAATIMDGAFGRNFLKDQVGKLRSSMQNKQRF